MSVHQCGCERGGLCTTITECYADQVLRDETERLERELAEARERIAVLENALRGLHDDVADYQRINNLGGYDNHWMRIARAALGEVLEDK